MAATAAMQSDLLARFRGKRIRSFALPALILVYLTYVFFAFDLPGLASRARLDNAAILMSDAVAHKVHVTRDNRSGEMSVSIEGSRRMTFAANQRPDWVQVDGDIVQIDLPQGHSVTYDGPVVSYDYPGYGVIRITSDNGIHLDLPTPEVPDFINASSTRVAITTPAGRLSVTRSRTETLRYFPGWELFFFDLASPYWGMSWAQVASTVLVGERLDPAQSNVSLMVSNIWNNTIWRHGDVVWALGETILMAFLGTFGAAMIALPLAFLAAGNFAPSRAIRFVMRRIFDFVRGVDGLIFTIILSRAFGPGPMTGALAILTTDTGSFGKLFSEALENVDDKQIEGIRSTGADVVQRYRFGVIPQVLPVLLSQVLYMFESNTRSATIIGAIVGGGIGLLLTQAIQTTADWEKVTYYIILIVLMVFAMDALSGWLRRRLIKGDGSGR
ncbi:phosphonate ABC transporter, permease protein PhnE [Pararhodobacter zhoushanensis]|uniref:Phosphonate ABC transporter, permease protein PhnE n=1 Tax=Pararhodobacter zhoushanensis TaxID=2479545 RepID=A0ABT3H044_9RHOB|nr:phosphonate ABC transporter, permease protein PhnE [Pararhodobacter zhoushanensis]MCW1933157.1 phosphonate ABC transporter, permease protein PhnE [Pararhodobacter zhoushanensis]